MNRAYSVVEMKSLNDGDRIITGIATTPTPDRIGDIIVSEGVQHRLPLPLLWQHKSSCPVGSVTKAVVSPKGIQFEAQVAKIDEPGPLQEDCDRAWQSAKAKLVRAVSIGFSPLSFEIMKDGGYKFTEWEWLELSLVTIPANSEALISTVKSFDEGLDNASKIGLTCATAMDLPILSPSATYDPVAATKRMLDAAGIGGDHPMPGLARRGFLIYDAARPNDRGAYMMPIGDLVSGELMAHPKALAAQSERISRVNVPSDTLAEAKKVLAAYGGRPKAGVALVTSDRTVRTPAPSAVAARTTPATTTRPKEAIEVKKTLAEQIAALETTRATKQARMEEVMGKSMDEDRSSDASESEEFDTLQSEVDSIDKDLNRLRTLERIKGAQAAAAASGNAAGIGLTQQGQERSQVIVKNTQKYEPGIRFAHLARCIGLAKGNLMQAAQIAENQYKDDDQIVAILKTAVLGGTSISGNWAANLVGSDTSVFADFVEFLRPQTILGRFGANGIPALRRVPFRVPLLSQTSGGSGFWVGQGKAKPLTNFGFGRTTLEPLKVANIAVVTEEVLRDSSPAAANILRDSLAAALRERLDIDFVDPAKSAVSNVSPASITNGISALISSGNDADAIRADVRSLLGAFVAANNAPTQGVWIMSSLTALALSLMVNALGNREFPNVSMNGGTFEGMPVITSEYVPTDTDGGVIILINAGDIYEADDGDIVVDISREASLEMSDAPANTTATPTAAQLVSLWQTNSVGFRAERTINWKRRRDTGVQVLTGVNWGQPGS